jgi:hypothetical protein
MTRWKVRITVSVNCSQSKNTKCFGRYFFHQETVFNNDNFHFYFVQRNRLRKYIIFIREKYYEQLYTGSTALKSNVRNVFGTGNIQPHLFI